MSNWREYSLGELGFIITGKTPSKNIPEDWGSIMPFITPTDYKYYRKYALYSERYLSEQGINRLNNKVLPKYSVLVTCIGSDMGKVVINKNEVITNQQINSIRECKINSVYKNKIINIATYDRKKKGNTRVHSHARFGLGTIA